MNYNQPLISVIVPVYKVEKYLDTCVQSIVNQTYRNLEIILVDDGSPDNCPMICDNWSKEDNRIKVIHKANGGLSSARNAGLDIARGEYIGFVDSDDFIKKTMYEHLLQASFDLKSDITACGRIKFVDENNIDEKSKGFTSNKRSYTTEEAIKCALLGKKIDVAAWDKLYKKELFKNIRYPVGENNEDVAIFYKLFQQAKSIGHCGSDEYFYRMRSDSISQSKYSKKLRIDTYKHHQALLDFLTERYPNLIDDFWTYHELNVYYFLVNNIKSVSNLNNAEYRLLFKDFQDNSTFFFLNKRLKTKDKIIGWLIIHHLYNKYITLKKIIKIC